MAIVIVPHLRIRFFDMHKEHEIDQDLCDIQTDLAQNITLSVTLLVRMSLLLYALSTQNVVKNNKILLRAISYLINHK